MITFKLVILHSEFHKFSHLRLHCEIKHITFQTFPIETFAAKICRLEALCGHNDALIQPSSL